MQSRRRNAILLFLFLVLLVVRVAAAVGDPLHFDEPFWLIRGDFLVGALLEGDWNSLQEEHWTVVGSDDHGRLFKPHLATETGTALLSGLSRLLIPFLPAPEGIDGILVQIVWSRLVWVCCSVLTALLLLLLARRLDLPWAGQLSLLFFLTFDPLVQLMGSKAHLESFLTLTIPVSLLLFALPRARNSLPLTLSAGVVLGLAVANRINGGVAVIAALAYMAVRWCSRRDETESIRSAISRDILRLGCFCLVGWAVFILCFPPLWKSPLLGFVDFLYQQASSSGMGSRFHAPADFLWGASKLRFLFVLLSLAGLGFKPVRASRLFQLGMLLWLCGVLIVSLPGEFYPRYLSSSLPGLGLAGSCTLAYTLGRWKEYSASLVKLLAGALLLLTTWHATSTTIRYWDGLRQIREFYGELYARDFNRIEVPSLSSSFHPQEAGHQGPSLLVRNSLDHLQLFYLGVLLTDRRRLHQIHPGWIQERLGKKSRCQEGDWRLETISRRNRHRPNRIRYREWIAWPCGG